MSVNGRSIVPWFTEAEWVDLYQRVDAHGRRLMDAAETRSDNAKAFGALDAEVTRLRRVCPDCQDTVDACSCHVRESRFRSFAGREEYDT